MYSSILLGTFTALLCPSNATPLAKRATWPGFSRIKTLFVFGDSYSRTGFDVNGTQPSTSNPLGNPAYPGDTSSNGPNWVEYLTLSYNSSLLFTYNFGTSGATLNSSIVASDSLSVQDELNEYFLPLYADSDVWDGDTSLFAVWVGINDINKSYTWENVTTVTYETIFEQYRALLDTLYESGARNFLLVNVPPIDRAPVTTGFSTSTTRVPLCHAAIENWNSRLDALHSDIGNAHSNATVFYFDANRLFDDVIDDPTKYRDTAMYKNTTGYCEAYANGSTNENTTSSDCAYPANDYLWLNSLHPTTPMHNFLAAEIAGTLND